MDWFNLALDLLVPLIMIGIGLSFLDMLPFGALAWWRTLPYAEGNRGFLTAATTGLEAVVMLLTIIPVERALYQAFDKQGNRK